MIVSSDSQSLKASSQIIVTPSGTEYFFSDCCFIVPKLKSFVKSSIP